MELYIGAEIHVFLFSLILGVGLAVLYDFFRIVRITFSPSNTTIFFEDLLYWCVTAIVTFLFFFVTNSGVVRGYAIFGAIGGACAYFATISRALLKIVQKLISFLRAYFAPIHSQCITKAKKVKKYLKKHNKFSKKHFKSDAKKCKVKKRRKRTEKNSHTSVS